MIVEGVVEVCRRDRKGFKLGDEWYSTFQTNTVTKGDRIKFDFIQKGDFKNVKGTIEVLGSGESPSVVSTETAPTKADVVKITREHCIIRQNALAHATNSVVSQLNHSGGVDMDGNPLDDEQVADRIIQMAYKFEAYSTGQLEYDIAEKIVNGEESTDTNE